MKKVLTLLIGMSLTMTVVAQTNETNMKPAKLTALKCQGTTTAGNPCKSTFIMKSGYCKVHDPNAVRCGATTSSGKPCRMVVDKAGVKCRFHSGS